MHVLSIFSPFRLSFKYTLNSRTCMILPFTGSERRKAHYFFDKFHIILQILFLIFKFIILFKFYFQLFIINLFRTFSPLCLFVLFLRPTSFPLRRLISLFYILLLFGNVITHNQINKCFYNRKNCLNQIH